MPSSDVNMRMNLGAKQARSGTLTATIRVDVKVSRRFIWMMKLRYIWAIIRATKPQRGKE